MSDAQNSSHIDPIDLKAEPEGRIGRKAQKAKKQATKAGRIAELRGQPERAAEAIRDLTNDFCVDLTARFARLVADLSESGKADRKVLLKRHKALTRKLRDGLTTRIRAELKLATDAVKKVSKADRKSGAKRTKRPA